MASSSSPAAVPSAGTDGKRTTSDVSLCLVLIPTCAYPAAPASIPPQGSGKTLAFGLPILQQLLGDGGGAPGLPPRSRLPGSDLRALVLLPTRELALQVNLRRSGVCALEPAAGWSSACGSAGCCHQLQSPAGRVWVAPAEIGDVCAARSSSTCGSSHGHVALAPPPSSAACPQ